MSPRFFSLVGSLAATAVSASFLVAPAAHAGPRDKAFFESVAGEWKGPGEIVAGKYKGTKFNCTLKGEPTTDGDTGIKLDGSCRVGVFTQPMSATITQKGSTYTGTFLDGAAGKGLDIVSGTVADNRAVMGISRAQLNGALIARVDDPNSMNVTISVKVEDKMVPVIGMTLSRQFDSMAVGSIR